MRTSVSNGSWNEWKKTTRFIVDSYHYTNHRANDELCRKYCNPAPSDGSAPNLVGQKVDKNGVVHDVREFNTQTCEQLNAWLGGFESILKRMTSKNFNWFLHVMLFYHVEHVLTKSVPLVEDNQDDDDREEEKDSDSEDEESGSSSSSSGRDSSQSSEEESTTSSSSSGKDNMDLNSEKSDDNDTEVTTTNSDDEVPIGDTNDEMVEESEESEDEIVEEDEMVEEDDEEDEDEMEVDDD
jgi:hypothetical protein